ncbi:hypothetical protein Tco_1010324 [Tanacetum coccineum]
MLANRTDFVDPDKPNYLQSLRKLYYIGFETELHVRGMICCLIPDILMNSPKAQWILLLFIRERRRQRTSTGYTTLSHYIIFAHPTPELCPRGIFINQSKQVLRITERNMAMNLVGPDGYTHGVEAPN